MTWVYSIPPSDVKDAEDRSLEVCDEDEDEHN
jgi:hypothetical protein